VELAGLLTRFSEGLLFVDNNTTHVSKNARTGETYLPGVKTMSERKFVEELVTWWTSAHAADFNPDDAIRTEVPYPDIARANCDLILSSDGSPLVSPEWSIEVKHIALVGNNGKNNDFGVAKILSPYLKDRSLIHDIYRLQDSGIGKRRAVIGYCFSYDFASCTEALERFPQHKEYIDNILDVCSKNDPKRQQYSVIPMIEFAHDIFSERRLVSELKVHEFADAWRHPCGGKGHIFGWEVVPKELV
jgi:hypothetical protein